MLETRATVINVDGSSAMVQSSQATGCGQCDGKGCGTSKLSRLFCSQPRQFKVRNPVHADVGDEVIIAIVEGSVMRGIGLVYLLPLLLMFLGALLGNAIAEPQSADRNAASGAMLGLAVGFLAVRMISKRLSGNRYQPYIARISQG